MKTILFHLIVSVIILFGSSHTTAQISNSSFSSALTVSPETTLWYQQPASKWEECLPVGNGRLGAMWFGDIAADKIQFNEETYWSGGPYSTVVKGGYKVLPEIQRLVFEDKHLEAHNLFGRYLMGYPVEQQKYQNMGWLYFDYPDLGEENKIAPGFYLRSLDLTTAIARVAFKKDGVTYFREMFVSPVDQVIAIHLWADKPGKLTFDLQLRGERNQTHSNYATDYFKMDVVDHNQLVLTGKSADYMGVPGRIRYEARAVVNATGGELTQGIQKLKIRGADEVTIYLMAATNFVNYHEVWADPHQRVMDDLQRLKDKTYEQIKEAHIAAHQKLFNRLTIKLPTTENSLLPTDIRLAKDQIQPDPSLAALAYQFGRYLMISSSRPGTQPANLQGIWNKDQNPSWDSKYTTNINTEMNYWAVESANLSECALPLMKMILELTDQGSQVAREHYGARGWVFHQNTDIWRVAAPMDGPTWGTFTTGGAWLCTHIWEHYAYTRDLSFLQTYYPVIKGAAQFFLDFLVTEPKTGWLVTNPSTSPENFPASADNGKYFDEVTGGYRPGTTICYGSTIDIQIITDLFTEVSEASKILGVDENFRHQLENAKSKLPPMQIGRDGMLQEWAEDWGQLEKQHRHFSHLYGIYPGYVISPVKTPELIESVKKVLKQRGDGGTGFSRGWKMAIWARLFDGNHAYKIFRGYLKEQCYPSMFAKCYTPLQVDGSFGVEAGINEMLVQSHEGYIELLPALPAEWSDGAFSGVLTRGGFILDFSWNNGRLTHLSLFSKAGGTCRIKLPGKITVKSGKRVVKRKTATTVMLTFNTKPGQTYEILGFR